MSASIFIPRKRCCNRIVGDDMEDLIKTAMTYIHRSRDFYEHAIREDLQRCGSSIVSCHASIEGGIMIYYDPNGEISLDDLRMLSGSKMFRKYPKFHPTANKK